MSVERKFKSGQKVRCIDTAWLSAANHELILGAIYEVADYWDDKLITLKEYPKSLYNFDRFEAVIEESKVITDPDKKISLAELAEMSMKTPEPEEDKGYYPHPSAVSGLPRGPVTHRLKAHPDTMRLLRQGEITSNIRKHDRDYRKGDRIVFQEYTPTPTCIENKGRWSSATFTAIITHVQGDNCDGLATGFCVLSLAFKLGECLGHDFNYAGKYDPR